MDSSNTHTAESECNIAVGSTEANNNSHVEVVALLTMTIASESDSAQVAVTTLQKTQKTLGVFTSWVELRLTVQSVTVRWGCEGKVKEKK